MIAAFLIWGHDASDPMTESESAVHSVFVLAHSSVLALVDASHSHFVHVAAAKGETAAPINTKHPHLSPERRTGGINPRRDTNDEAMKSEMLRIPGAHYPADDSGRWIDLLL